MKLGAFPTLEIVHTGKKVEGQIYIGSVNWILCILCIAVIAGFNGNGTQIGYAYGLAISATFLITTWLVFLCMVIDWKVSWYFAVAFWVFYSIVDGAFLAANLTKVYTYIHTYLI